MATRLRIGALLAIALATALVACESPTEPVASPKATRKPVAKATASPKANAGASASPKPAASPTPSPKPSGTPTPAPSPTGSAFTVTATPTPLATPTGPVVLAGTVSVLAGSTSQYPDPAPENVKIAVPGGLAVNASGQVYVADQQNHRIRIVDPTAGTVRTFAGGGAEPAGDANGPLATARFRLPVDVVRAASGALYVADGGNAAIRKIDAAGATVSTVLADSATPAESPKLGQLRRMAIDPASETLYVAGASAIYKVEPLRTPVAVTKLVDAIADGIAYDPRGALVFANREGHVVRRLDLAAAGATPTVVAGSGTAGKADGQGAAATFDSPEGVAVDREGTIYVADTGNDLLRKITPAGLVSTLAAGFDEPLAIAIGPTGSLYVSEGGGAIRLVK